MNWPTDFDGAHSAQAPAAPQQTPQSFVKAALAAEREQWTGESARPAPTVVAAARALCAQYASTCNVDEDDAWKVYGDSFLEDAKAALDAAAKVSGEPA